MGLSSAPEEAARTLSYQAGSLRKGKRLLDKVIESRPLLECGYGGWAQRRGLAVPVSEGVGGRTWKARWCQPTIQNDRDPGEGTQGLDKRKEPGLGGASCRCGADLGWESLIILNHPPR